MTLLIEAYTGTQTVSTTEWSMTTDSSGPDVDTTDGIFTANIDLNAMAAADVYLFQVYEKCRTGDSQKLVDSKVFQGVQSTPVWTYKSPPLGVGWDMTLLKLAGADCAINWRIDSETVGTIEAYTGTETVGTTDHSLTTDTAGPDTDTTDGIWSLLIDISAMAAADVFQLRVYEKSRTGDTQRLIDRVTFNGVPGTPLFYYTSPPLGVGWDMVLDKVSGSDVAVVWRIDKVNETAAAGGMRRHPGMNGGLI